MFQCSKCGAAVPDGSRLCPNCRAPLGAAASAAAWSGEASPRTDTPPLRPAVYPAPDSLTRQVGAQPGPSSGTGTTDWTNDPRAGRTPSWQNEPSPNPQPWQSEPSPNPQPWQSGQPQSLTPWSGQYAPRPQTYGQTFDPNTLPPEYRPLSAWAYWGLRILYSVPVVGWVFFIIFLFKKSNLHRRSFTRSYLCTLLLLLIAFGVTLLIVGGFGGLESLFEALF